MSSTNNEKILCIEDTPAMQTVILCLLGSTYNVKCVGTLQEAQDELKYQSYSMILLDVNLPDGCGFEFCEGLRKHHNFRNLPIVFLTSKDSLKDRIHGYSLGADDYVTKPIEPKEFIARIKSRMNRMSNDQTNQLLIHQDFKIDMISQKAFFKSMNLDLSPIEFKFFSLFIQNVGKIFSYTELKKYVWGPDIYLEDPVVDIHIQSLKNKLGPHANSLNKFNDKGYCLLSQ